MDRDALLIRASFGFLALGMVMWSTGVAADWIGLGGQPGFNWKQIALAEVGLVLMLAGILGTRGLDALRPLRRPQAAPARLRRLASPEGAVAAAVLAFVGVTAWWLSQDARVPNGDSGRHLVLTHNYLAALKDGSLLSALANPAIIDGEFYPPLGHLVGVFGSLIAGFSPNAAILTENLVFVPLLALGCYGAGREVFGRRAGAFAAVFALSVPILVSQWHAFQLDAPQTAMVAMAVWLLLLSQRFGHVGYSALAGVAVGLATMIKVTSPVFLAAFVIVLLVRGGWRNWRGILVFGLMVLLIAQPWLLAQEDLLRARIEYAVDGASGAASEPVRTSGIPSEAAGHSTAYLRVALSVQYYLPLCVLFVVGTVASTRSWISHRRPDCLPEMLIGVVGAYLVVSSMSYFDPRYSLPALVFLAVLGTGWMVSLSRRAQTAVAGLLVALFVLNTSMISTGLGRDVAFGIPGVNDRVVVVSDVGYVEAEPRGSAGYRELFGRAREKGVQHVLFEGPSLNTGGTNLNGLATLAYAEGLAVLPGFGAAAMGPRDIYMVRRTLGQEAGVPCIRLPSRQAIYVYRGSAPDPDNAYCP